jgi:hypothetical protein
VAVRPIPAFPGAPPHAKTPKRQNAKTPKRQKLLAADPPPDAIFNQSNIEINQQPDLATSKLQISRQLGFMNRQNFLDRLNLDNDQPADNHIHPIPHVDPFVTISHRKSNLLQKRNFPSLELTGKALLVNRLQQSRTQGAMNRERSINNLADNQIMFRRGFNHLGALALNANKTSARTSNKRARMGIQGATL